MKVDFRGRVMSDESFQFKLYKWLYRRLIRYMFSIGFGQAWLIDCIKTERVNCDSRQKAIGRAKR